ncbi:MAG TPA: hypothetical protein VG962_13480 [Steroidobacteraceae bacterium]|nr:hypothetical protein [Steroidobacteraceae bacterium]
MAEKTHRGLRHKAPVKQEQFAAVVNQRQSAIFFAVVNALHQLALMPTTALTLNSFPV